MTWTDVEGEEILTECVRLLRVGLTAEDASGRDCCPWCNCYVADEWGKHADDCQGVETIRRAEALLAAVKESGHEVD